MPQRLDSEAWQSAEEVVKSIAAEVLPAFSISQTREVEVEHTNSECSSTWSSFLIRHTASFDNLHHPHAVLAQETLSPRRMGIAKPPIHVSRRIQQSVNLQGTPVDTSMTLGGLPPTNAFNKTQQIDIKTEDISSADSTGSNEIVTAFDSLDAENPESDALPLEFQCRYRQGKCSQPRTLKKNGSMHSFCEYHRSSRCATNECLTRKSDAYRKVESTLKPSLNEAQRIPLATKMSNRRLTKRRSDPNADVERSNPLKAGNGNHSSYQTTPPKPLA
ncbi:hypothetical protein GQ600_18220 [Phytophthora cactorum]|nr:hypothetical protein GQ600_18220 [Phytophthora cactorum]